MVNDFYTFVVTSTINTEHGKISIEDRIKQTIVTIESIKRKVSNIKILFIDNSVNPFHAPNDISDMVDLYVTVPVNLFTYVVNSKAEKGLGELYMMYDVMELLEKNNMIGKRIFKISGRYKLADSFDIQEYNSPEKYGKYCFKINQWDVSVDDWKTKESVIYFETRLWSFCHTLFCDYKSRIPLIFDFMLSKMNNLEKSLLFCLPHESVYELATSHVEGITADTGIYKFE